MSIGVATKSEFDEDLALERRGGVRKDCAIEAKIQVGSMELSNCIIKNISKSGALIALPTEEILPSICEIVDIKTKEPVTVQQVWRRDGEMGVCFVR